MYTFIKYQATNIKRIGKISNLCEITKYECTKLACHIF